MENGPGTNIQSNQVENRPGTDIFNLTRWSIDLEQIFLIPASGEQTWNIYIQSIQVENTHRASVLNPKIINVYFLFGQHFDPP